MVQVLSRDYTTKRRGVHGRAAYISVKFAIRPESTKTEQPAPSQRALPRRATVPQGHRPAKVGVLRDESCGDGRSPGAAPLARARRPVGGVLAVAVGAPLSRALLQILQHVFLGLVLHGTL